MGHYKVKHGKHRARDKKLYLPGQTFEADPLEVEHFMDKLERLDEEPEPEVAQDFKFMRLQYGKYDVFNGTTGAIVNDDPLTRAEAEAVLGYAIPKKGTAEDAERCFVPPE